MPFDLLHAISASSKFLVVDGGGAQACKHNVTNTAREIFLYIAAESHVVHVCHVIECINFVKVGMLPDLETPVVQRHISAKAEPVWICNARPAPSNSGSDL